MQFSSLNLSSPILDALRDEGYETPTPIQAKAITPALEGHDLLGCAQTGTGKTAAFALPIIEHLITTPPKGRAWGKGRYRAPRALVLSPTRELATQIGDAFATYARNTPLRHTVIYGGVSQRKQEQALARGVDVIVATPGRLIDLMEQGIMDLNSINHLVLDEADRMLDMGFIHPIRRIAAALPESRQTMLFSATMPKPIMALADSLLTDPVKVAVTPIASAAPLIEQAVHMIPKAHKQSLLEHIIADQDIRRALVFTRTKHGADRVARRLSKAGIAADAIHGNKSQAQRERALRAFRSGRARILVATDVAARGIDVDNITHVFNYDLPNEPESYVHRIGRTGRAGASGAAIAFCDRDERDYLKAIEKLTGTRVPVLDNPQDMPRPTHAPARHHDDRPDAKRSKKRSKRKPNNADNKPRTRANNQRSEPAQASPPRKRIRKTDVPAHPSSPARARERAEAAKGASEPRSANKPAAKPSYSRGPHSRRTRRPAGSRY